MASDAAEADEACPTDALTGLGQATEQTELAERHAAVPRAAETAGIAAEAASRFTVLAGDIEGRQEFARLRLPDRARQSL